MMAQQGSVSRPHLGGSRLRSDAVGAMACQGRFRQGYGAPRGLGRETLCERSQFRHEGRFRNSTCAFWCGILSGFRLRYSYGVTGPPSSRPGGTTMRQVGLRFSYGVTSPPLVEDG
jgi:hypothetical protein